ncbi:AMP-binding protein [Nocardia cyriacigeorgica]|uniref:Long-chain fatty acid--CoA ligase n=1 Tax=Nocardia cyriacigeorgica TaxID=135487 RepID=A0A6P1D8X3_9NOCA|nr:AMP-binding protein [Nocardia cyriacigeorgica]NEW45684.1 long-chain fatty acid--CoA ligase [Nocardia cyriacigeorgica]
MEKPWLLQYRDEFPAEITARFDNGLAMLDAAVASHPDVPAIRYFDGAMTFLEIAEAADALAVQLIVDGFQPGDRLAVFTQNDPAFVIALLAAWKAGGVAVPVNPMNQAGELRHILTDSGATALVSLDYLYRDVAQEVILDAGSSVATVVTFSDRDFQSRDDFRVLSPDRADSIDTTIDLLDVVRRLAGRKPPAVALRPGDAATITYTSGTTGRPKGAINTHRNLMMNATTLREWIELRPGDAVLAMAPLFHITGLVAHVMLALMSRSELILTHRFHPEVTLEAIRESRPTFTVGAITAFIALANAEGVERSDFDSFTHVYSGGAAIPPAVADEFEAEFGVYIHNAYGLTETSSVTHFVPFGRRAPVDENSGALSIGVPVSSTLAWIVDESGAPLAPGQIGELIIAGPQVTPGYWRNAAATAETLPDGELRTGDIAFMDEDGWFYIVDRKKDMINASGYKVWPREVEDAIYSHAAVREAAVVGVPDPYRGETVRAYVSLTDKDVGADEIVEHCKRLLAAYKYPREVVILDELPKTASGKILRRELRQ